MSNLDWQIQSDEALFPDIEWSQPQQKNQAGKLLIIGGHAQGFNEVGSAYQSAINAKVGEIKVVLPDKLKPVLKNAIPEAVFASSTPSGSFSESSLNDLLNFSEWADAVLIVQPGTNSETSLLLTRFVKLIQTRLVLTDELIGILNQDLKSVLNDRSLLVLTFDGMQKLAKILNSPTAFLRNMGLRPFILALNDGYNFPGPIISVYEDHLVVKFMDKISSTKKPSSKLVLTSAIAGFVSVWWLQQPGKTFEAITTSAFEY